MRCEDLQHGEITAGLTELMMAGALRDDGMGERDGEKREWGEREWGKRDGEEGEMGLRRRGI